ncbi:methylated-DNA--[protein]-cysteine S-methyltransferase [Motilimonas pumila]|uniref:methylated-DNA--[protein]-cysteine S-methyltransferase n=2 Tax=Motilimonas pumila TaxID=2303987 RepID=A0A418YAW1_9GAMM|nr:methylated-DNA--[protein]-cysteine S-methyltransferase [Motilimonas pumila]
MQQAVKNHDARYDGRFYYGVVTTGIVCRPSCPAKPAQPDKMRFFTQLPDALLMGFRPCQRCNPSLTLQDNTDNKKQRMIALANHLKEHAEHPISLKQLGEQFAMSPSRLQKAFKATFGISPKAYQSAMQMARFKSALQHAASVTDAIYEAGFSSSSRVYGEASRQLGMKPNAYRTGGKGEQIHYACRQTSLGLMLMAATDQGVCFAQFGGGEQELIDQLKGEFPHAEFRLSQQQHSPALSNWIAALDAHMSEGAPRPDLPLDLRGTAFQIKVWQFLLSMQSGTTCSYQQLANNIDHAKAVRAVGTACGKNRIAVLVPCHRVLRSDGGLGGYRWGLARKQALLTAEQAKKPAK